MGSAGKRPQILIFSYHKSGTTLFDRVMRRVANRFGLRVHLQYGMVHAIDPTPDIVLLPHSLLGFDLARPHRGVRIVRDPRDIWVSSYLYHRRTREAWCINTNLDPTPPITYPRVDFCMLHRPERWKRNWLARLNGQSYQQNLLHRDQEAGLAFELGGYTACTLDAMRAWRAPPGVIDIRLEDIVQDFDPSIARIFHHLGFNEDECAIACALATSEDLNRMDDATVAANEHIHSRILSKWRTLLTPAQVQIFEAQHSDLIRSLGYQFAGAAPQANGPGPTSGAASHHPPTREPPTSATPPKSPAAGSPRYW